MNYKQKDIFHYMNVKGGLTLRQSALNEVDALILSVFAYLDYSFIKEDAVVSFPDAVKEINRLADTMRNNGLTVGFMNAAIRLANVAAESERFREMEVFHFVDIIDEDREMQFSAISFLLPDRTVFLSFRGTDNTLVGWKEDLNMGFMYGVPAQWEAVRYVARSLDQFDMPFRLGGHSKGGNLAVWAGAHLPANRKRNLIDIYNNDGPGFDRSFLKSEAYQDIRYKVQSFVPAASIVGVLMDNDGYTTICSSSRSVLQHNPFTWLVNGSHFLCGDTRTAVGRRIETAINAWIHSMTAGEREEFLEHAYAIVCSSGAKTLEDIISNKRHSFRSMRKAFTALERETQMLLKERVSRFRLMPGN